MFFKIGYNYINFNYVMRVLCAEQDNGSYYVSIYMDDDSTVTQELTPDEWEDLASFLEDA